MNENVQACNTDASFDPRDCLRDIQTHIRSINAFVSDPTFDPARLGEAARERVVNAFACLHDAVDECDAALFAAELGRRG